MRQRVCVRLPSSALVTLTSLASSNTSRWRLRFPSVSAHKSFSSPNHRPFGWVRSEVSRLRRARSCITRLSPSYANRELELLLLLRIFVRAIETKRQHAGDPQLTDTEWNSHDPRRDGMVLAL